MTDGDGLEERHIEELRSLAEQEGNVGKIARTWLELEGGD